MWATWYLSLISIVGGASTVCLGNSLQVGPPDDEHLLLGTRRGVEINTLRKSELSWSLIRISTGTVVRFKCVTDMNTVMYGNPAHIFYTSGNFLSKSCLSLVTLH